MSTVMPQLVKFSYHMGIGENARHPEFLGVRVGQKCREGGRKVGFRYSLMLTKNVSNILIIFTLVKKYGKLSSCQAQIYLSNLQLVQAKSVLTSLAETVYRQLLAQPVPEYLLLLIFFCSR